MHIHVVEAKCECACASSQLYSYLFSENHRFQQDIYISVHFFVDASICSQLLPYWWCRKWYIRLVSDLWRSCFNGDFDTQVFFVAIFTTVSCAPTCAFFFLSHRDEFIYISHSLFYFSYFFPCVVSIFSLLLSVLLCASRAPSESRRSYLYVDVVSDLLIWPQKHFRNQVHTDVYKCFRNSYFLPLFYMNLLSLCASFAWCACLRSRIMLWMATQRS
jgi:hypothetical protein